MRKSDRIAAELESLNDVTFQVKKVVVVPRDDKWELAGTFELEEHDEVIVQLNGQLLEFKTGTTENIALAEEEYEITLNLLVNQKLFVQSDPDPINLTSFVGGSTTINHTIAGDTTLYVLETDILQIPVSDRTPEDTLPDFDSLNKKYFIHIVPE